MAAPTSDVEAAHQRGTHITAVTVAFLAIAWISVLARTWVRAFMIRNYGWDDAVMLLAVMAYTLYAGFNLLLVSWGFGNPDLALDDYAFVSKVASYILATFSLYAATMVILKISLGIFYLRIAVARWQKITVYVTVGIAAIFGTYYFFAVLFECGTPSTFLSRALQNKCNSTPGTRFAINITAGIINATSDFILAILPVTLLRRAAMPFPAKVSALAMILLGCTGSAVSVVRLVYIHGLTYSTDFFSAGVNITIWSIVEAGLCITAASLATLRPLFRCFTDAARRTIESNRSDSLTSLSNANHSISKPFPLKEDEESKHQHSDSGISMPASPPPRSSDSANWPLKPPAMTKVETEPRDLDDLVPRTGVTRKASISHGKVQWLDPRVETPSPGPGLVLGGKLRKQASVHLQRKPSKPKKGSGIVSGGEGSSLGTTWFDDGGARMEEVGVGAWRVVDGKGGDKEKEKRTGT